jgi:hypothetical protein
MDDEKIQDAMGQQKHGSRRGCGGVDVVEIRSGLDGIDLI